MSFLHSLETFITNIFVQYAYQPWTVAGISWLLMLLTCFGLPLPEEFIIIGLGLVVYLGLNPDPGSPPPDGAHGLPLWAAILAAYSAVLMGDSIAFGLGRYIRSHSKYSEVAKKFIGEDRLQRSSQWMKKYGFWTAAFFRFTPGLRLPGQFSCGFFGVAYWRFIVVVGSAAMLAIPTQIYFISRYGQEILQLVRKAKGFVVVGSFVALILVFGFAIVRRLKKKRAQASLKV